MSTYRVYITIGRNTIIAMIRALSLDSLYATVESDYPMGSLVGASAVQRVS
jgi:hypothetical protein